MLNPNLMATNFEIKQISLIKKIALKTADDVQSNPNAKSKRIECRICQFQQRQQWQSSTAQTPS